MAAKAFKLSALSGAFGLACFRVYAINKEKSEALIPPRELPIYKAPTQPYHFVEDQPGLVERGLHTVRVGLHPYAQAVKGACISIKIGTVNLYYVGEDIYHYLKDPPPGFLPRVSFIAISGLAGLILARKGSRLKRIATSLGLATLGTAVCYPAQTVGVMKVTGRKVYAASQWTTAAVASLWKVKGVPAQPVDVEPMSVSGTLPDELRFKATPQTEMHSVAAPVQEHVPPLAPEPSLDQPPLTLVGPVLGTPASPQSASPEAPVPPVNADTHKETRQLTVNPRLMDHGQSNPDDADLYSTRS